MEMVFNTFFKMIDLIRIDIMITLGANLKGC
jgi:hypothetical protein